MNKPEFKVRVDCITFNHAAYIVDAMNGFTMQKTSFPVATVIVDDASTDGEPDVIRKYLDDNFFLPYRTEETDDYLLICAKHKSNYNCTFVVFLLKYNHYQVKKYKQPYFDAITNAEYVAMCEGDDYWIDPQKLSKQAAFMDSHPNHSLCIHAFRHDIITEDGIKSETVHKYSSDKEILPDEDVLNRKGRFGSTASLFYRKTARDNYPKWASKAPIGDRPLKMVLFLRGHIGYLDDVMCVYREGTVSSWTVRMKKDLEYREKNIKGRLQLAKAFDKYSKRKYHHIIKKEIWGIRYELMMVHLGRMVSLFHKK